jgi:hypothetical protein
MVLKVVPVLLILDVLLRLALLVDTTPTKTIATRRSHKFPGASHDFPQLPNFPKDPTHSSLTRLKYQHVVLISCTEPSDRGVCVILIGFGYLQKDCKTIVF